MNTEAVEVLQGQRRAAVAYRDEQAIKAAAFGTSRDTAAAEIERMDSRIIAIDDAIKQLSEGK